MLLALLGLTLLASTPTVPPTSCLFANGKTACGYSCQRSVDDVRCASTPYGTCAMFHDRVYCFDPPLSAIHHPPDEGLRPDFRLECFDPPSLTHCAHAQPPDPAEVRKPKYQRREAQAAKPESAAR